MKQISAYLLRQLTLTFLVVIVVMTGVIWLFVSVRAVESIINRGLSFQLFLTLTSLQLPNFLIQVLPIALFIAVLFVYNRLTSDREILVMRAAGMSPLTLAKPIFILGGICVVVGYAIALYVTPQSYQKFRDLQWDVRYSFTHVLLKEGVFNTVSDAITVYIRERTGENELRGLLIHDTRDPEKTVTVIAERGAVADTPEGARVLMFEGNRQEMNEKTGKLSTLYFDRYSFDLEDVDNKPGERHREARERTIGELLTLEKEDLGNPNDFGPFVVEAHQRLTTPLNALGYALIAFLCLVFGEYSRRGQTIRVVTASAVFIGLQVVNLGLINVVAKNLQFVPLIYVTVLAPIVIALAILWRNPMLRFGLARKRRAHAPAAT